MMTVPSSNRLFNWRSTLLLVLFYLSSNHQPLASTAEGEGNQGIYRSSMRRVKRERCQHDFYQHEGKNCCLCAAGEKLSKPCRTTDVDRECLPCELGNTYNSHPNSLPECEPCTSCSHPSANLQVETPCNLTKNTVCGCKPNHYCEGGQKYCKFCLPSQQSYGLGIGLAVTFTVLIIVAALGVYLCRKKQNAQRQCNENPEAIEGPTTVDMEPLINVDLSPHVIDIAAVLGWKVMRDVALSSGLSNHDVDCHVHNHPNDIQEQTLQLLICWVEKEGMNGSQKLLQKLQMRGNKGTAEKVRNIIKKDECSGGNSSGHHVSV
ncbi:tumor necrosis factor receptor superfamily member 6 [Lampris incognitus]|uniref:tumor necrosis factor receptor superfamily member 6 n=1 Tax=Lampris incognitus TaxID=2546036 RepID=UPI0024B500B5|nr:tumor necrosis factor receptor superfamily member 6 [Lampris incognitus]